MVGIHYAYCAIKSIVYVAKLQPFKADTPALSGTERPFLLLYPPEQPLEEL